MNITEANHTVLLLKHLDGSQQLDETDLSVVCVELAQRAGKALQATIRLDEDRLVENLAHLVEVVHVGTCTDYTCRGCIQPSPAPSSSPKPAHGIVCEPSRDQLTLPVSPALSGATA